jgi:hypothetical protein
MSIELLHALQTGGRTDHQHAHPAYVQRLHRGLAKRPLSRGHSSGAALDKAAAESKSATMTLDQYGHLFGDRLDVVADAMDAARTSALVSSSTTRLTN